MTRFFTLLGLLTFAAAATASDTHSQPAHIASPDQYDLLLENDRVLVLKMVLEAGEQDLWHHHRAETVYFERGGTLEISVPGEEPIVANVPTGHVMAHGAWTHRVRNLGNEPIVAIIVEQKQ
jgi:mannose-6-phosphate isomerase-like protein (cupin superfamily)